MGIKITLEATCDMCGQITTVHTDGSMPIDPAVNFYGGDHTEYGWVCERTVCAAQVCAFRAIKALADLARKEKTP